MDLAIKLWGGKLNQSAPRVLDWLEQRLATPTNTIWQDGVESTPLGGDCWHSKDPERNGRITTQGA